MSRSLRTRIAAVAAVAALSVAGVAVGAGPASAATFTVTNLSDSGAGSLRQAVADANATPGLDTITFSVTGAIPLDSTITVTEGLFVDGPGSGSLSITRTASFPMLVVQMAAAGQSFLLDGVTLDGTGATTGRGLHITGATPALDAILTDTVFTSLSGTNAGQALAAESLSGELSISTSQFDANVGSGNGGAVLADGVGAVTITDSTFSSNTTTAGAGGGVAVIGPGTAVTITGSSLENNSATDAGGALYVESADAIDISTTVFHSNDATNGGGGAYLNGATLDLTSSSFDRNLSSGNRGGGVLISTTATATVSDCDFLLNEAELVGGGIYVQQSGGVTIQDCGFDSNVAASGGAIYFESAAGEASVIHSAFEDNSALVPAPAIAAGGAIGAGVLTDPLTIVQSTFEGNSSWGGTDTDGGAGAAISVEGIDDSLLIDDSTFLANFAGAGGFGLSVSVGPSAVNGLLQVTNSTFVEPSTDPAEPERAALALASVSGSGRVTARHSTFTGDAVLFISNLENDGAIQFTHDLVDSTASATPFSSGGVPATVEWSLFRAAADPADIAATNTVFGVADLKLAPLAGNGGPTQTRLPLEGSPAIGGGNPAVTGEPAFDQRGAGFDRVQGVIDIGSVEQPETLPATGGTINWLVPVAGATLLLAGLAALITARVRRASAERSAREQPNDR